MKTKKVLVLLLCAAMILSFTACSGTNGSTSDDPDSAAGALLENGRYSQVTAALAADPENLEPKDVNNIGKNGFIYNIYESLFDFDDNGMLTPSIGKEITLVDATTTDVTIYDCVYDSAGNHITADDVVYSVNWLVDSGNALKYEIFDSVEAIEEFTVRFHWAFAPTSLSDLEFPLARTMIFAQTAWESGNFATLPVATGNYVVKEFVSGSKLVLEANDGYWALADESIMNERLPLHRATVQTLVYEVIGESSQAAIALEQETIDYCDYINAVTVSKFEEGGEYSGIYNVDTTVSGDFYVLTPNLLSPIMDDINLRLAIWYAIDSTSVATVMGGNYAPLKAIGTTFFSDYETAWENDNYMCDYDPDLAKEYLEKSNYKGETLKLVSQSAEYEKNALTMIQNCLNQIGIKSEINACDASIMKTITASAEGWDISLGGCGGTSLIGTYNRLFSNTVNTVNGKGYTLGMIDDPQLQSLYETARADDTHDTEHMTAIHEYVLENGYMYALVGTSASRVSNKNITSLYFRENHVVTLGASTYAGQTAPASSPRVVLSAIESAVPDGYVFYDDDGTMFVLNIADDSSWTLSIGDAVYTGDKSFPFPDAENVVMTTPPNEGKPDCPYYEDDGVCKWVIIDDNNMVPLKYADVEGYTAQVQSGSIGSSVPSGYTYVDEDGTKYVLCIAEDSSWTLYVGDKTYTGDKSFESPDAEGVIMTTPPNEGKPDADFYEDDGVCKWHIIDDSTMIPVNRE
ncbi:MAG: ABC transporter substrate-binding protein [Oscillospiraceae bacterium]